MQTAVAEQSGLVLEHAPTVEPSAHPLAAPAAATPIVLPPGTAITPMHLLQMALTSGADLDRLEKLMDLHQRWERAQAEKAFVAAMAQFKKNAPKIIKDSTARFENKAGGITQYDYATLGAVCVAIIAGLAEQGISHKWKPSQDAAGKITVTCVLTHKDGHSEEAATLYAMADTSGSKNSIQAIASTVSYLEKYTLLAATGMATNEQDDDSRTGGGDPQPEPTGQPSAQQKPATPPGSGEKPVYSQDSFNANFPSWSELITSGKKSPEQIIATVSCKARLTDEQKTKIREVKKAAPADASK